MEHGSTLLRDVVVYLAAAVVLVPLFIRFKLGAVLGYLAAGVLIGPAVLGLVGNAVQTLQFAEFGIVLLLFVIGLELQPSRRLQFQTDHEQQQHDTELGELQGLYGIANEAQHRRPDQDTCSEIAQHRPQLEANEQWHQHHRRRQIDDDIAQQGGAMLHQAATCPTWARAASTASSASRIEGCRAR